MLILGSLVTFLGLTGAAIWHFIRPISLPNPFEPIPADPPTPDPRLVFDTPYRNVKPDVKYVGDDVCARCHQHIAESYHAHPMGRSAEFVTHSAPVEKYNPAGHSSFSSGAFDLDVVKSANGVQHSARVRGSTPVPVAAFVIPAEVAIGSGTRGRSYLSVEHDAVWQTPISWFGPEERWDVSPGFRLGSSARRAIIPACLYCHVNRVEPIPGADNRYRKPVFANQLAIGCERCHGPGELHATERDAGTVPAKMDTSIVNPRNLSPQLQAAICEQCHLQGEERVIRRGRDLFEFRPGLPFEQFVSVYVRHPDIAASNRSVGQFELMEQSHCFSGSRGALRCTSCHDPHSVPDRAARDTFYRQKCLTCHDTKGCSLPQQERVAKNDSCVACHMPKAASSNIIHASVTDHRIPRIPGQRPAPKGLPFGASPLVRFRAGPFSPPQEERDRDLGIALAHFGKKRLPDEITARVDLRSLATERLRKSLVRWPGDPDAWLALASVGSERGEDSERLRSTRNAVRLAPNSEAALATLVEAATAAGKYDEAEEAADRAVSLNPSATDPLLRRAVVHLSRGDWERTLADSNTVLRSQPLHPQAHLYRGICLHKLGDPVAGQRELQTAMQLEPDARERSLLTDWYQRATH
jgi:Tfp pilus assembly protein PilF